MSTGAHSDFSSPLHPSECLACIDTVLASLAARHLEVADHLLDLKIDTRRQSNPGGCVRRYFEILSRLPRTRQCTAEMTQVRVWLESLIDVVACPQPKAQQTQPKPAAWRIPLHLSSAGGLQEYCEGVINDVRDATAHRRHDVALSFSYRPSMRQAA
jgi:hypothetical protein